MKTILLVLGMIAVVHGKGCGNLNLNGQRVCRGANVGSTCTYTCSDSSTRTVTCLSNFQWSTAEPCPAPAPAPPAPAPAPAPCSGLSFDLGDGQGVRTLTTGTVASGSSFSFSCANNVLNTRSALCSNGVFSTPAACPAACGAFSFDTGLGSVQIAAGPVLSDATVSFSCANNPANTRVATCTNGVYSTPSACPAGFQCAADPLFMESQALITEAFSAGVAQDRDDRFRVEWIADTVPVIPTAGTLAQARLPRQVGQFELLAECAIDQAPTLAELPVHIVGGTATFRYNGGTLNWNFGPLFNPVYLTPPDLEPGILIADDIDGAGAILQLIWVEKFIPAEGPPGPVRVRVQANSASAFPNGWPADTVIEVDATFQIQVAGQPTIYTYSTGSGEFTYGTPANAATVAAFAFGAVAVVGAAGLYLRKRLQKSTVDEGHAELPELEIVESDFVSAQA